MRKKSSMDAAHAKTRRILEESMSARVKALALKSDEKDNSKRVKSFFRSQK